MLGDIDPEKESIFAGVETVERSDAELLAMLDGVVLFPAGTRNAEMLTELANNPKLYETLYDRAMVKRGFGDVKNGEVVIAVRHARGDDNFHVFGPLGHQQ